MKKNDGSRLSHLQAQYARLDTYETMSEMDGAPVGRMLDNDADDDDELLDMARAPALVPASVSAPKTLSQLTSGPNPYLNDDEDEELLD